MKDKILGVLSGFTQFVSWPFVYIFFHSFFKIEVAGKSNIQNLQSPLLLIANHICFYDSFVFRIILNFYTRLLPLRFMAVDRFQWRFLNLLAAVGFIDLLYFVFGSFKVYPGKGIVKNIQKAKSIIESGGNVVIYPEGKIMHAANVVSDFKKGAAFLAKSTNVPVLPIALRILRHRWRKVFRVNIGELIVPETFKDMSIDQLTCYFHNEVENLYLRQS